MAEGSTTKAEEGPRSFAVILARVAHGECLSEASTELHTLMSELAATAKSKSAKVRGKMTLTLELDVSARGEVSIGHTITRTSKKPKAAPVHGWVTKGGNLTFENPRQEEIPGIREVPAPKLRGSRDDDDDEGASGAH